MIGPKKVLNLMTWHDFTVQQEHLFLKNIYSSEDFSKLENLKTLNDFYDAFEYFLETVVLLNKVTICNPMILITNKKCLNFLRCTALSVTMVARL